MLLDHTRHYPEHNIQVCGCVSVWVFRVRERSYVEEIDQAAVCVGCRKMAGKSAGRGGV